MLLDALLEQNISKEESNVISNVRGQGEPSSDGCYLLVVVVVIVEDKIVEGMTHTKRRYRKSPWTIY